MINQVPKCLSRLINGITDEKQRQALQNEFLYSCAQLSQKLLIGNNKNVRRLQWQISENVISVLSTIEKKWDPYQLDTPIEMNLLKNYINVWFHLVTVSFSSLSDP